jgi:opacity protein-like surface antigen
MRLLVVFTLGTLAISGVAHAQSTESAGYVEAVAQSAFGNVTSQSFGVELGVKVWSTVQVFADVGYTRDTAPAALGTAAQGIAGFLSQTNSGVTFSGKQPVAFGVAGLRYAFASSSKIEPYVLVGGGVAKVKKDVSFAINGTDVTATLPQLGVVLGTDLSGSETKPMLSIGVGAAWAAWQHLVVDFQYRYGRVFTSDEGLNISRAGVGLGVRF